MDDIVRDDRHMLVEVIATAVLRQRRFAKWSMAYHGPASLVAGVLDPVTSPDAAGRLDEDVERLIEVMRHLAELRG